MYFDQMEFDLRCEWGERGVAQLAPQSDAIVIVDVLSFSTSVDIAVGNGAWVYPYRGQRQLAQPYAESVGARLADFNRQTLVWLLPSSIFVGQYCSRDTFGAAFAQWIHPHAGNRASADLCRLSAQRQGNRTRPYANG